jgi:hypothetical protein
MSLERSPWAAALAEIRRLNTELRRVHPYRDDGLVPNPPATRVQLAELQARLGFELPPSYQTFLLRHDGWSRFFDGVTLLGTQELGQSLHQRAAQVLLDNSLRAPEKRAARLLPFGVDAQMCSVFAFDVNCASAEKPVLAWVGELGIRADNFTKLLELLAQIAALELHSSTHTDAVNPSRSAAASAA